jgi:hypothetical protein
MCTHRLFKMLAILVVLLFSARAVGQTTIRPPLTISDSDTRSPLNITVRSAAPTSPAEGEWYIDDGTNRADSKVGWRRYSGSAWVDIGQGYDSDLAAWAALTPTTIFKTMVTQDPNDALSLWYYNPDTNQWSTATMQSWFRDFIYGGLATARFTLGLGSAAIADVNDSAGNGDDDELWSADKTSDQITSTMLAHNVAYDHNDIATALQPGDIGSTVQGYSANMDTDATDDLVDSDIGVTVQAYSVNLDSWSALAPSVTTPDWQASDQGFTTTPGTTVATRQITTTGEPVWVHASMQFQWDSVHDVRFRAYVYRDSTQLESSRYYELNINNIAECVVFDYWDDVTADTYTYTIRCVSESGGDGIVSRLFLLPREMKY